MKTYAKAQKRVIQEQQRQLQMINCVCFIALYRMGWDADKIVQRFNDATDIWNECREKGISTFELLENETEIEMALDGEKSWHEFDQFAHNDRVVTDAEYIYSLHRRQRWIAPLILACLAVSLHRVDGWGYDELVDFLAITDAIRESCGDDVKVYAIAMEKETGYTPKVWE